ncbi:hypothetical protein [Streptomyces sp. 130]|uniref:hypothetical protein n=1 Tax=Streptomyces sp. 130 TaxID=2591006 RepID=UPI00163D7EFC|nr:hypothetical protein [Streptomyces sp. 130]
MSMPPPPQGPYGAPQGPYGPPPPQPNPYAQQQPWGAPQGSAPQPWGAPPGGPRPSSARPGVIAAVVAGALLVAGGIVFGVVRLGDEAGHKLPVSSGFPAAEYKLTVPKTLLEGEYTLQEDTSATDGKDIEDTYDPTIRDPRAVVTQYASKDGGTLIVSGMWGRIKKPELSRDAILEGAAEGEGMTVAVPAREFTPAGYGITVACEVVRSEDGGVTSTLPMCAWGDDNTASFVAVVTEETALQDPDEVDLAEAARQAAQVREEMREPIGTGAAG